MEISHTYTYVNQRFFMEQIKLKINKFVNAVIVIVDVVVIVAVVVVCKLAMFVSSFDLIDLFRDSYMLQY